ncbi:MAG TPA: VOC family protein [Capillimicrobium sp.]
MGEDGGCDVGAVRLQLGAGGEEGLVGWALRGLDRPVALDGLAAIPSGAPARGPAPPSSHPLGAVAVDHVVARTPDLARTTTALEAVGLEPRRTREAGGDVLQTFFVLGPALLELVGPREPDGDGPARFWGLVLSVADLDAACARLGDLCGQPRDAVQPGRRIAVVRREAGLGTACALMSPRD